MPEIATRLNEFEVSDSPLAFSANFDFSVSNISSRPIFIVKCDVVTDGLPVGGGGYGERFAPCNIFQLSADRGLELLPGQTAFFNVQHRQDLDDHSPILALERMGIDLEEIRPTLTVENCIARFFSGRMGSGVNQNCRLMQSSRDQFPSRAPAQKVFDLILRTGTGDLIRSPVYLSVYQPWPWGT